MGKGGAPPHKKKLTEDAIAQALDSSDGEPVEEGGEGQQESFLCGSPR